MFEDINIVPFEEQLCKLEQLKAYLKDLGKVAIAYSSGVDSTFLLKVATDVLHENAVAITAVSYLFPKREKDEAGVFCKNENIEQIIYEADPLNIDGFAENPVNRCYICKKGLFGNIIKIAVDKGIKYVAEGSNKSDEGDYRPGMQAIKELGIKSPLRECGLTKDDIRVLSHYMGLPTWNKPSYACLASRVCYGEEITKEKLEMVDAAEQLLYELGFKEMRVRVHGNIARIEVPQDKFADILTDTVRNKIYSELKNIGFSYITLDLLGFRSGSMNETIKK